MTADEFAARYPRVYHVAEVGSWPGIARHGLLSTSALLDLYGIDGPERERLESRRRPESYVLDDAEHGRVVLRDQKPLSEDRLAACLQDMTPREWIRLLNGQVFFWLSEPALAKLLAGREYRDRSHDVITFDTSALLKRYGRDVRLSPINSGATLYKAAARGSRTFLPLTLYDTLEKRDPVELAIRGGVGGVSELALVVEERSASGPRRVICERPEGPDRA